MVTGTGGVASLFLYHLYLGKSSHNLQTGVSVLTLNVLASADIPASESLSIVFNQLSWTLGSKVEWFPLLEKKGAAVTKYNFMAPSPNYIYKSMWKTRWGRLLRCMLMHPEMPLVETGNCNRNFPRMKRAVRNLISFPLKQSARKVLL